MPIFEYICDDCGELSEFLLRSGSKKKVECSKCGSQKMQKKISAFAPQIKAGESKKCHGCQDFKCPHAGGA